MRKKFLKIFTRVVVLSIVKVMTGYAQVRITGPACVSMGKEYQYELTKGQSGSSNMQVCLTDRAIAKTDSMGCSALSFSFIRIIWTDTARGNISLITPHVNDAIVVDMMKGLGGGKKSPTVNFQRLIVDSITQTILCSEAIRRSFIPLCQYEWQRASDGIYWEVLFGATSQNREFLPPAAQTTFFKRGLAKMPPDSKISLI